ncbi:MAG: DUF4115 domain-containing protein [Pseudodesulfovibrio sp.]|nr:DUF4115 domain-containing protein [Pseudodesulfovibrio sp.]
MNFQELGLILQRERERKGFSIEMVMETTKISRINIVALEKGDSSMLPHPVYTKGFVKSYARLLGLDADELSMVVDREYQSEEQDADDVSFDGSLMTEKACQEVVVSSSKKQSVWLWIIAVVFLIGLTLVLVVSFNRSDEKQLVESPVVSEAIEEVAPVVPESSVSESEEESAEVQADEGNGFVEEELESVEQQTASQPVVPVAEPEKPVSEPEKPVAKPEKPVVKSVDKIEKNVEVVSDNKLEKSKYDHVLIIRATTQKGCWIGVWKEGEAAMARDFVLKDGEPLRLMFNSPRRIRIGNAAGVSVVYNGKPYPLNESSGNIQTLLFGTN